MKKLGLVVGLGIVGMIGIAIATAGKMGETSHSYARGKVVLADGLEEQAKNLKTLFIIALGHDRPMPIGAMRKSVEADPKGVIYEFILTKDNMQLMGMGEGMEIPESFRLKARLDGDGQGGPDQPGDIVGEIAQVSRGSEDLEIRLERVVPH